MNNRDFFLWLIDRLILVYGEDRSTVNAFHLLRTIAASLK
jgi:hypothetical protein